MMMPSEPIINPENINVYMDESGSITHMHADTNPYFVVSLLKVNDAKRLHHAYKRFISSHLEELKRLDHDQCMFHNDKFHEMKGYELDEPFIAKLVNYFARNHLFDLFYLKFRNDKLTANFCINTARAFNYVLRHAIEYFLEKHYWDTSSKYLLQLDERNEKTRAKFFLEDYLNTELYTPGLVQHRFQVQYFDSANNDLIQLADVFSNLFYKSLKKPQTYGKYIRRLKREQYLKFIYSFPLGK